MAQAQMQSGNAQTQSAMPPQFTPDEVVEILTEAVNLSSQYVSLAQLEAIADEAGIPRETLYQVIRKRAEQSNKQVQATLDKQLRRQQRIQRWKSRLKKLGLTILILTLGIAAISISYDLGYQEGRGQNRSSYWYGREVLPYFENLTDQAVERLALRKIRGKNTSLYILPRIYSYSVSNYISSIWMKHSSSGSLEPIYKTSGNIIRATLSPNERLLAFVITGSASEGVWVLDLQTNESHRISSDPTLNGLDIAWLDDRTLILPTDNGRYRCELNERGVPLRYKPLGE
jgi:hypothetical protein